MGKYRGIQVKRNMSLADRLDFYTIPEPNSGCYLWLGSYHRNGYGQMSWGNRMTTTNRLSWIAHRGPIIDGLHVLHKCDVRACCNPDHLFLGTHDRNMADMDAKGRRVIVRGIDHGAAKLTEENVLAIRSATGRYSEIAERFGVSKSLVCQITKRQIWKHL